MWIEIGSNQIIPTGSDHLEMNLGDQIMIQIILLVVFESRCICRDSNDCFSILLQWRGTAEQNLAVVITSSEESVQSCFWCYEIAG